MSEKQYEIILAALADKIKEQETKIAIQEWQISMLKKALAEVGAEANENAVKEAASL